jgi:hypothetical protein
VTLFRCRRCDTYTRTPLEHAQTHDLPSTLAQVWEMFSLVATSPRRAPRDTTQPPTQDDTLPID